MVASSLGIGMANLLKEGMEGTIILKVTIIHDSGISMRENAKSEDIRGS